MCAAVYFDAFMRNLLILLASAAMVVPGTASAKEAKPVAAAPVEDAADVLDVTALKDRLVVVTDGKGHYLASAPEVKDEVVDGRIFYSPDGKTFWEQRVQGYGSNGPGAFDITFWEPRIPEGWKRSYGRNAEGYSVQCDDRVTKLTLVPAADAKTLLGAAVFKKPRWKTMAYALARDDHGRYFYVDKPREPRDSKAFRVFMGQKNALKPLKMVNVVSDSQGDIFATRSGELRLLIPKNGEVQREPVWIKGKKKTALTWVPVEDNANLIYTELGVYTGQPLGTACDDL
jgi:hypothetical protein